MTEQNQKSFSYFMDRTIHNMNFSEQSSETSHMRPTNLQQSISSPTYQCVLTPCKYPIDHTILKKRKNENICETSTYYVQRTKPKIITYILWIEQNTIWTFQIQRSETTQMRPTNLQHSISSPTYPCVLTLAEFPSKEHESKVPEPS